MLNIARVNLDMDPHAVSDPPPLQRMKLDLPFEVATFSTKIECCKRQLHDSLYGRTPVSQDIYDQTYALTLQDGFWNVGFCGINRCVDHFENAIPYPGRDLCCCGATLISILVSFFMILPTYIGCSVGKAFFPSTTHWILAFCAGESLDPAAITARGRQTQSWNILDNWCLSLYPSSSSRLSCNGANTPGILFIALPTLTLHQQWIYRVRPDVLADNALYLVLLQEFSEWCRRENVPNYASTLGKALVDLEQGAKYEQLSDVNIGYPELIVIG